MPNFIFDTCCGCIELRTGCLIITYLNLISDIAFMIVGIVGLSAGGEMIVASKDLEIQTIGTAYIAIGAILLLVMIFLFAFTVVLLVGIHQNKRGHVKVYLIVSVICLAISIITTLCSFSVYYDSKEVVSRIFAYIVSIYFLMVIRSYYYKMEDKPPAAYNTA